MGATSDIGRMLHREVSVRVSRSFNKDPRLHLESDISHLIETNSLASALSIPNAASLLDIETNFVERKIISSMAIYLPKDKARSLTSLNWLKNQIPKNVVSKNLEIHIHWPGRTTATYSSLNSFLNKPETLLSDTSNSLPTKAIISSVYRLSGKYNAGRAIVDDMSKVARSFYRNGPQN